jgi:hypothetical protein
MTRARKKDELLVLFNKRPNPVCVPIDEKTEQPIGIRLEWFPSEFASSPTSYFTADQGRTFHHVLIAMSPQGADLQTGDEETNPEAVSSLRALFAAWSEISER